MDDVHEYSLNKGYGSSQLPKVSVNNANFTQSQLVEYVEEDDDEAQDEDVEEEAETNVDDNELNETMQNGGNDDYAGGDQYDEDGNDDDDDVDDDDDDANLQRHPKKRKLKSLLSSYEFAPQVPPPISARKPSFGGRNTLTDWSEHETFVLLDAWGERYLKCNRKSLRSDEWLEVADRVSQESKIERTDSQCRNRLDTLKKKYKKEKASLNASRNRNTKWVYFKKMDMLLSGGNVATSSKSNGIEESRGTSGNSQSQNDVNRDDDDEEEDDDDDDLDLLPPKKSKPKSSFKLLADSINKFSEIYEKIENSKIQQMKELEKMKMDFHKDLELQRRQILDRAQAEIRRVQQGDYEDNDVSAENLSG